MAPPKFLPARDVKLSTAPFFVLRTPLVSWDLLERWGDACRDGSAPSDALREIVARPEVREALFLASPSLDERVKGWLDDPACKDAAKIEQSVAHYVARMAGRATPL